jgi:hypothetical protein
MSLSNERVKGLSVWFTSAVLTFWTRPNVSCVLINISKDTSSSETCNRAPNVCLRLNVPRINTHTKQQIFVKFGMNTMQLEVTMLLFNCHQWRVYELVKWKHETYTRVL